MKVPSQIFRWFEKMKNNYEHSVQSVLSRFEQYNLAQQDRIDNANKDHINSLKDAHDKHLQQNQSTINQLHKDIDYYKQQIANQQQTIAQLNSRYDAVMSCLLAKKTSNINVKDIFDSEDFITNSDVELPAHEHLSTSDVISTDNANVEPTTHLTDDSVDSDETLPSQRSADDLFELALEHRNNQELTIAFDLFSQAAAQNHAQSMGALGRSYFLGEGVEEDHIRGLAWLIRAAELALPQAIKRVEHFEFHDPELFLSASELAKSDHI